MNYIKKTLSILLIFAMLLTLAPMMGGSAQAAYNTPLTTNEETELRSAAIGEVTKQLLEAVRVRPQDKAALCADAAVIFDAIKANDAAKSEGLGILGQGMIGAMKRCYMNNKPFIDDMRSAAVWIVDEIAKDDAAASKGLGKIGAALMDAGGETGRFTELRSDVKVIVDAFAAQGGAKKGDGLATLGQGMIGAMKRCYMNNKLVTDDMRSAAAWIVAEIAKDDAAASNGLGIIGAALMDAGGETGHFTELRSDVKVIVDAFAAQDGARKSEGLGILGQGMIGAMKRCYINNKPFIDDMRSAAAWIVAEIAKDDAAASKGLGEIGAALMDAGGETGHFTELRSDVKVIVDAFAAQGGAKKGEGLGILGQGMIGAMKRCYINNKPFIDDMRSAAAWIVDEIAKDDAAASRGLGIIGAALMDAGGETGQFTNLCADAKVVVDAFAAKDGAKKGDGLGILGQGMIGAMKRCYINNKPFIDDMRSAAAWIVDEIAKDDAAASKGLGEIGAALMDAVGEIGHFTELRSDVKVVVNAFAAQDGAKKGEGLGTLGQGMIGAMKRCYLNNKPVTDDMRSAAAWIVAEIAKDDAAASKSLGEIGAALMDGIGETGKEYRSYVEPVVTAIGANDAAKSEGLGILGTNLVARIKRCYMNNKPVTEAMCAATELAVNVIAANDAAKSVSIGMIDAAMNKAITQQPAEETELRAAAASIIAAIAANNAAKSRTYFFAEDAYDEGHYTITGITKVGEALLNAIESKPGKAAELRAAADSIIAVIAANHAVKSEGLGAAGAALMGEMIQPQSADPLLDTANTVVQLIAALDETYTVTFDTDGGRPIPNSQAVLRGGTASRPAESPVKHGFSFDDWYTGDKSAKFNFDYAINADTTVVAKWVESSSRSHDDTTSGATTTPTTNADGSTTVVTTAADNSTTTTATTKDGSVGTVRTDAAGNTVDAEAKLSEKAVSDAAAKGKPVAVPATVKAAGDAKSAAEVKVTLPADSGSVKVEIPVEKLTPGTVALIVRADGTEEIVKTSTTSADGVVLTLNESATVKIINNAKPMHDVKGDEWYADSVAWATSHEIMNGVGDGNFDANAETSRAQITQLLMNLDGAQAPAGLAEFSDVHADSWFADSVAWATENGIANGMGESFGANDSVSREDLAVMLYRYAQYKGYDVSASGNIALFPDADDVNGYAQQALAWAIGAGLINGTTDAQGNVILDPHGSATRGQIAAIINRFCENVAN